MQRGGDGGCWMKGMTYDGHVSPGGLPAVRELGRLAITKVSVGPMDNNAYVLRCRETGDQVLVDAAAEPDRLIEVIGRAQEGPVLDTVVTTHRHGDHWGALGDIVRATGAGTIASELDARGIGVPTDRFVADGDVIRVGDCHLEVITLRGHTEASIALLYDDPDGAPHLFTGDALFPGGIGNTRGNAADFARLLSDVTTKLFDRLPDETWFYPGHGDDSCLGLERPHVAQWARRGW